MSAKFASRVRLITVVLVLTGVALVSKLYLVQVVRGEDFSERADRQYAQPRQGLFDRGSIFFTDKNDVNVSAATLKSGFTVSINPQLLGDSGKAHELLASAFSFDQESFFLKAGKKGDPYEEIASRISEEEAEAVRNLNMEGVAVHKDRWRYYPGKTLAAHALGFVAFDENELSGRYGLERYYEDVLSRGENNVYINFFAEIFSNIRDVIGTQSGKGKNGDIVLTLEPVVQAFVEGELEKIDEKWDSKSSGAVVINPKTGEIYSLAISPTFNLNEFQSVQNVSIFGNPIVENVFEMGSIIKPLTMAAGLDAGVVTPKTTYNDKGFVILNGARLSNYDGKGRGVVDMQRVLNESLNTGAAFVAGELGNKRFADYMFDYGIAEETGIDLPGETVGLIDNLSSPRDLEYATASFGQGIAMTPIATVRALSSLANGGTLITPHLVSEVKSELGYSKKIFYDNGERVLKEEASEEITRMLVKVVDEALLGGTVKLDRYSVAAKTGTAQIANPNGGGYYDDRFLHSFFGYFPAFDPEFLVFLYILEPHEVRYASQTLTGPFMDITKFLISYYEIPPDR